MPFTAFGLTTVATGMFGSNLDGAVVLDGVTNYPRFAALVSNVYTLQSDMLASSLVVNAGITVKTNNCRMFIRGSGVNNGTITSAGNNAVGSAAGASQGSIMLLGGRVGGAGGTGVNGAGGNGTGANYGQTGGTGGAGTSGAGGTGGSSPAVGNGVASTDIFVTPYPLLTGEASCFGGNQIIGWGSGGGGGGSDAASNAGGGGGGGAGVVAIFAYTFVNNGSILATGGNGAAGTGGNAGGGGGGAGGAILVATLQPWTPGTTSIAGGTPGAGVGTGAAGNAGGVGLVLNMPVS